jgi:hypothetical protein
MSKLTKISLFSCLLLAFLFGFVGASQSQDIDPRIFENQPPLTDEDIQIVIQAMPQVNVPDLDQAKFEKIAKSLGVTEERLNFAIIKSTFGLMIELKETTREALLRTVSPAQAIPTASEQILFGSHREALEKVFER